MDGFRQYSLKELRARLGKSQREVAQDLNISLTTYNGWEQNVANLKVSTVMKLADYFGVELHEIFLG